MPVLECRELEKRYGAAEALAGVSLRAEAGRVLGLLGPNGAGKTTLIKLACGLLQPTGGEIRICGLAPGAETKKLVSFLPDRMCLPAHMSAEELLGLYGDFFEDFERERAEGLLAGLGIDKKQRVRRMSRGAKEKLQLVLAMSRRAKLYLLDEPIGGVDPASREFIISAIMSNRAPDAAVIIATQLISEVELILDDAVFLDAGRVVLSGEADALRGSSGKSLDKLFREVFKCSASS